MFRVLDTATAATVMHDAARPFAAAEYASDGRLKGIDGRYSTRKAATDRCRTLNRRRSDNL